VKIRIRRTALSGKDGVRVVFADNGCGIPDAMTRTIFEPFVSTKGTRGTGLGLWVSAQIIQKHGGSIRVKSSTDTNRHGTVFSVFLPARPPDISVEQGLFSETLRAVAI
jgi:signal transduction histidine kinase